jgi:glycosyltransferase involved in cell wall biosynthesis
VIGVKRRIAIVTNDILTPRMAGPAIRAWHMAEVLATEHEVRLVSTIAPCELRSDTFGVEVARDDALKHIERWCDILVFQGAVMYEHPFLRESDRVLVVDLYNPMHLETLEQARDQGESWRTAAVRLSTLLLNEQMARGDYFLAASPKQRDFWLGSLAAVGRINPILYDRDPSLGRLISVVPFGLPGRLPEHRRPALKGVVPGIGAEDRVLLWGGGVYNWFDPLTLLWAVDHVRRRIPDVRLYFLGLRHPNPMVPTMRMASQTLELANRLDLVGTHVFFNDGWVPYEDRENYLLEADIGISTHLEHVETAFSFRTRILDYLWAGLPIVATEGDFFAELINSERLGVTVPPRDVAALAEALTLTLEDHAFASECRGRALEVARRFVWPEVLQPLAQFCRQPSRSPDLLDQATAATIGLGEAPPRPPTGLIDNLRILLDHLEEGGPRLVVAKARSRLSRRLAGPSRSPHTGQRG